ncbi:MAG: hypothetical protein K0S56_2776 [Microvirga sp.]|nr:hypothetical protein [Microvirga sp.]
MFIITDDRRLDSARAAREIDRLLRLAADLRAIREGSSPSQTDLIEAPILDNWAPMIRPIPCLVGDVSGHPLLPGSARKIATSDLWVLADHQGWARTLSRWYRLGLPRETVRLSS